MDPAGSLVLALGLVALSGLLHLVRNQTTNGRIDRNSAIGIRTRATQSSDAAWLAGHRAASPWLLVTAATGYASGLLALVLSVALMATDTSSPVAIAIAFAGYIAVIFLIVISTGKANAAAHAVG